MSYIEVDIKLVDVKNFTDIAVARLNEINFESYEEKEDGVKAYVQKSLYDADATKEIINELALSTDISCKITEIKQQNWNRKWENSFSPVYISSNCVIRADFHDPIPDIQYEIIITPKMSFGTGHHETTALVMEHMFELDFSDRKVLDMGCGTGVLSILSAKLGANDIVGIDIDDWSFANAQDNARLNNVDFIQFRKGTADLLTDKMYDIILANINRNVLLSDLHIYKSVLSSGGSLILSGFYKQDYKIIINKAKQLGFREIILKNRNKWVMLHLER